MKKQFFRLPESISPQARNVFWSIIVLLVASGLNSIVTFKQASTSGAWQAWVEFGVVALFFVALIISAFLNLRGRTHLAIGLMIGSFLFTIIARNALTEGLGVLYGMIVIAVISVLVFFNLPRKTANHLTIASIVIGGLIVLFDLVVPPYRQPVPPALLNSLPFVAALVFLILLFLIVRQAWKGSLRTKLLTSFLSTIVLTIASFTVFALYSAIQTQTLMFDQLETAVRSQSKTLLGETTFAARTEAEKTLSEMVEEVEKLAEYQAALYAQSSTLEQGTYWDANTRLTKLPGGQYDNPDSDIASVFVPSIVTLNEAMVANINTGIYLDFTVPTILQSNPNIVAIYFIGTDGSTIYYPNINLAQVVPPDFDPRLRPFYSIATPQKNPERKVVWTEPYQDAAGNGLLVTASASVYDQAGKFRGVVSVDVQLIDISTNVAEIKVGESGFAFLIDSSGRLIGMPDAGYRFFNLTPEIVPVDEAPKQTIFGVESVDLQKIFRKMTAGETSLEIITIQGEEYYVSYVPLSSLDYSLGVVAPVAELDVPYLTARDQFENQAQGSNRVFVTILVVILLAAIGASLLLSQFLSGPIVRLTKVAEQVTAGNMEAQAKVESADEIGALAGAFNRMTSQLREFIGTLESRVAERTRNIELAAEVGRTVSQVRALDVMLTDAAELIRSRFDLYYVQVYLTNPSQTYLNLQAGTGRVGEELLARNHRLPLNTNSINGRAAIEKKSVVILDTSANATFKPNPLLTDTRSEMAVPLMIGERVVGVLDMQSEHAGSLSQDILPAFEALAGQLAIAIQNATLLAETEQARAGVEAQARRLTRANWVDYLDAIHKPEETGFVFEQNKITPMTQAEQSQSQTNINALTSSITVTGESLGNLVVEMEGGSPISRTSELVNTVARQVAQQIESLRLLESAERYRAEAEESSRRITREGWKSYVDNANESMSYVYDLKEVRLQNNNGDQQVENTGYSLPLKVRDETIGKLIIQGLEGSDGESVSLATAVAERLGTHIESLRQYDQTQTALTQSERLFEASRNLSLAADLQELVKAAVETLDIPVVNRAILGIFSYDAAGELESMTDIANWWNGSGHEAAAIGTSYEAKTLKLLSAFLSATPVFFSDTFNDERMGASGMQIAKGLNIRAAAVLPLFQGNRQLGILMLQAEEPHNFSQNETRLFSALAPQIATVLENRRQFEQAQQQAERESTLNAISQKIQSATTVEAVLQIAARELGHALGAPMTIAQLSMKDKK